MSIAFQSDAFQNNAFQSEPPAPPVADFTVDVTEGNSPLVVTFTDISINYPSSWKWEYRSGKSWVTFSTAPNPVRTFSQGYYSIRLTVTNSKGSSSVTKNSLIKVIEVSDDSVIKNISISKRLNNSAANLTVTFRTSLAPDEFEEGLDFEFIVTDNLSIDELVVFTGIIEKVHRDENNNRIYAISGRDTGRLLISQPFYFDCEEAAAQKYSYNDVLNLIIQNTGLKLGKGLIAIEGEVE